MSELVNWMQFQAIQKLRSDDCIQYLQFPSSRRVRFVPKHLHSVCSGNAISKTIKNFCSVIKYLSPYTIEPKLSDVLALQRVPKKMFPVVKPGTAFARTKRV